MMLDKQRRKFLNLIMFFDLQRLEKKADPDTRRERRVQERRLRKLMRAAYKIPFYRRKFDEAHLTPADFRHAGDLAKFPLLYKQELRQWMDEEVGKPQYKYYYLDTTSGSSGTPTKLLYSPREKAWNMANWMRVLMKAGYDPYKENTVSRLSAHSASAKQKNFFQKFGILRRSFINQYAAEEDVIAQINEAKPDLLYMNKTELMRVALYAKKHGISVYKPRLFCPTGEMIDEASEKVLKDVFGRNMIDSFGSAETGACMVKIPGDNKWRIHGDLFVVNIYDDEGKLADEGTLAVTPLYKTDIPLINYVVGDHAVSEIIDGVKYITKIKGRSNDFIRHADGSVTTFFMITPIFAHCDEIAQMRVIQKSYDELLIEAVYSGNIRQDSTPGSAEGSESGRTQKTIAETEDDIRKKLGEKLKQPMNISFKWVDVIQPDPNGKLRLIVNEMKEQESA